MSLNEADELEALFRKNLPAYDLSGVSDDDPLKRILTADPRNRNANTGSAIRLGTSTGLLRLGTGFRPMTGATELADVNRPITAVRGAGYTSSQRQSFGALNSSANSNVSLESQKLDSSEERLKQQEFKIMDLLGESCIASAEGNVRKALSKAKEASNKERNLIRMQEQAGFNNYQNIDLTFSVLLTLANQYAANELYKEALNTYQLITKNKMFPNAHRLKLNIGNIYAKQGQFNKAIKMYRMTLDQIPSMQKNLRNKIMQNIALVFVKMGQFEEAITSLEYIMNDQPSHRAGLHLVLCCRALEEQERMRSAFQILLSVPADEEDYEKYNADQDNTEDMMITSAIRNDELHMYEQRKRIDNEYCILTAAKIVAPLIEDNFSSGYDACIEALKSSEYAKYAGDLEINKAIMFLKQGQLKEAIETLKSFDKESTIASNAAINLSFIYFLQGDMINAEKYGEIVKLTDGYNVGGFVNLGACALAQGKLEAAQSYFESAMDCDPSCVEALYNLGLVLKRTGKVSEALHCFRNKFNGQLSLLPDVVYHISDLLSAEASSSISTITADEANAGSEVAYQQLLGLVPTDAGVMQKLGELYVRMGDKGQAHQHHLDSNRYYPGDLNVIEWLAAYYIDMQVVERALNLYKGASHLQPENPRWQLLVAACHRRIGNMQQALILLKELHRKYPENEDCLRQLLRMCSDLGLTKDVQEYTDELKRLARNKDARERMGSSRPSSRKSHSGLSSRGVSGFGSPQVSAGRGRTVSRASNPSLTSGSGRLTRINTNGGSADSHFAGHSIPEDAMEPLLSQSRLRTASVRPPDYDEFADELLGDDLLPE